MSLFRAIDRVIIAVDTLPPAIDAYRRLLGRKPSEQGCDQLLGIDYGCFRLLNMCIELIAPLTTGQSRIKRTITQQLSRRGQGIAALVFASDNLDQSSATLIAKGLNVQAVDALAGQDDGYLKNSQMLAIETASDYDFDLYIASKADNLSPPLAQPLEGNPAQSAIDDIDHIVLNSADSDRLKHFLGDQLGLKLRLDQAKPEWGVRQLFFRVGPNILETVEAIAAKHRVSSDYFWGLAYQTPNVTACRERLQQAAVVVSEARQGRKRGTQVATIKSHHCDVASLLIGQALMPSN